MSLTFCGCGEGAIPDPDDLRCVKCGKPNDEAAAMAALREARIQLGYMRLRAAIERAAAHPEWAEE